jgi:hypothetical protein
LIKLNEKTVVLVVRKEDVDVVQGVVNDAVNDYVKLIKDATGEVVGCDVTINDKVFLPPAPKGDGARSWYVPYIVLCLISPNSIAHVRCYSSCYSLLLNEAMDGSLVCL